MLSEFDGLHCQHRSDDFPVIEALLRAHRPPVVIELGTDAGGFAMFLASVVGDWGATVWTFDVEEKTGVSEAVRARSNVVFWQADVLRKPHELLRSLLHEHNGRGLIYCDNGHKEAEMVLYGWMLGPGGLLATHDYGTEVRPEFAAAVAAHYGLVPLWHELFAGLENEWYPHSLTRFWLHP